MNLLIVLMVGGLVGWLAAKLLGRNEGIIGSVVIGIIGSIIGGLISALINNDAFTGSLFYWPGLIWAFIGSVLLVTILNSLRGNHSQDL